MRRKDLTGEASGDIKTPISWLTPMPGVKAVFSMAMSFPVTTSVLAVLGIVT